MLESIMNVIERVIVCTKSDIAFVIKPNFGRIVILDVNPLPDVKLFPTDQQGILDILLNHKLTSSSATVSNDVVKVIIATDSSTSG